MISVTGLVKEFEGFRALGGVDLEVEPGTVYGLVGPNGAGKTTLIRHLTGVYRQDSGQVVIDGMPVYENTPLKARIACIPDEPYFFPQSNSLDMMRYYKGIYPRFDAERYAKLRDAFPEVDEKRQIRRLSRGMQKQAAFRLAIAMRPDVLLLDEPVDGLDPVMRRQVWSLLMADVADRGMTILVSSHNLRELEDVCDHVGIMNRGKVILQRSLSELQAGVIKVQVVFEGDLPELPSELEILHSSKTGRVYTLIIRGEQKKVRGILSSYSPILIDALPLTLEEIFIYELGGADYAVREIIL